MDDPDMPIYGYNKFNNNNSLKLNKTSRENQHIYSASLCLLFSSESVILLLLLFAI